MNLRYAIFLVWLTLCPVQPHAEVGLNTYGMPGLIDMPSAQALPDADLAGTVSYFDKTTRSSLTFQATPRITAAFRYAGLESLGGSLRDTLFDRSFDVQFTLSTEGRLRPAIALGLRDFIGTGVYSAEYIVATKQVGSFSFTGGVGWGRLGGAGFAARFGPTQSTNQGGQIEATRWFSGDAAVFGGVSWAATRRLRFDLEYSSDSYLQETSQGVIQRHSPINLGADWQVNKNTTLKVFYLHGSEIGLAVQFRGNPARSAIPSGTHRGPTPVRVRGEFTEPGNWRRQLAEQMARDGFEVLGVAMRGQTVRVDLRNTRYSAAAEAIGRTARILSHVLPDHVETFEIVPVEAGMRTVKVTVQRGDLEDLEHAFDGAERLWSAVQISEAPMTPVRRFDESAFPRFVWGLGPYLRASFFDPDQPIMADFGLRLNAEVAFAPNLVLSGSVRKTVTGNFGESDRVSDSVLPKVRSEANLYLKEGDPALETLSLAYYSRPGRNLYGRITVGYLEPHFGGISTELLWKPVDSRFALGAELNYVRQRDFKQGFGFRGYDVVTGHVSAYYAFRNGFYAQIDAGRYLAGDWGATFAIDRTFRNGWSIGAYTTFTDVSFEDFGEGSFDKGLRFTIPLEPFLGRPTRREFGVTLQPVTRDGGARLHVDGRLYQQVRDFHKQGLESNWGRVWR